MSTVRRGYRVRGRVQGVGFRWWVRGCARSLGVAGWVMNLPDGSVRVEVSGEPDAVARLADALRRGPPMASVDEVEEEAPGGAAAEGAASAGDFEIR